MKNIILLGDGMADYPIASLGGKTPLEYSKTPNMDAIASDGTLGLVDTIPSGLSPGSDVANLAVLGYDPASCYSGRGPLEAANMGVHLDDADVAFRCNLITVEDSDHPVMLDFTAGHITSDIARELIIDLNRQLGSEEYSYYQGVSYRHLMVWRNGASGMRTTPPHDIIGREISDFLPQGERAQKIIEIMNRSREILREHPINKQRINNGKKPANSIWLWGQGRAPKIDPITAKLNVRGGMISAVDLLNGIGIYAGLIVIPVKGATGYIDTNYKGKAEQALASLRKLDFIFLHVEAPDEMGHEGNLEGKIKAIEDFDEKVVGEVLSGIRKFGPFRIMVLSDHPTPVSLMNHSSDPSPFAVLSSQVEENLARGISFGETSARNQKILISPGHLLMDHFIGDWKKFVKGTSRICTYRQGKYMIIPTDIS